MIYCLSGENSFAVAHELGQLLDGHAAERYDGSELAMHDLPNIFAGQNLFSQTRTIVVRGLSENTVLWNDLATWLERLDPETTLILVEERLDKRTRTYKQLQKLAKIIACDNWKASEMRTAEVWLHEQANKLHVAIDPAQRMEMVRRATRTGHDGKLMIDQQLLATVLEQLKSAGAVTNELIDVAMAPNLQENVFVLLAAALEGDGPRVHTMCARLSLEEDGHKVLGLVATQAVNLAALVAAGDRSTDAVAKELGIHPFVLSSLARYSRGISMSRVRAIIDSVADADMQVKRGAESWGAIESALQKITRL